MEADLEDLFVMTETLDDVLATIAAFNIAQGASLDTLNNDLKKKGRCR